MTTVEQAFREFLALLILLWVLTEALKDRQPVGLFAFEPPSPSALDQLSRELGTIGQAAWFRQQEAGGTAGGS